LDDACWETRKVEIYSDGHCGYASDIQEYGKTRLGIEPIPPFEEINSDPQFQLVEIDRDEFEEVGPAGICPPTLNNHQQRDLERS